jgi:hypothetical protein
MRQIAALRGRICFSMYKKHPKLGQQSNSDHRLYWTALADLLLGVVCSERAETECYGTLGKGDHDKSGTGKLLISSARVHVHTYPASRHAILSAKRSTYTIRNFGATTAASGLGVSVRASRIRGVPSLPPCYQISLNKLIIHQSWVDSSTGDFSVINFGCLFNDKPLILESIAIIGTLVVFLPRICQETDTNSCILDVNTSTSMVSWLLHRYTFPRV